MSQKKDETKGVKIQDLSPKKDAKGGRGGDANKFSADSMRGGSPNSANNNSVSNNSASNNSVKGLD